MALPSVLNFWLRGFLKTSPLEIVPIAVTHEDGVVGWEGTVPVVWGGTGVDKDVPSAGLAGGDNTPTPIISEKRCP